MALKKNISLVDNFGVTVDFVDAHIKVISIEGGKEKLVITTEIKDKPDGVALERKAYEFVPLLDGDNFIAQAYGHLKALPEFSGAKDF